MGKNQACGSSYFCGRKMEGFIGFIDHGPINIQWEEHCFDHWEDPHDSFLKPRIVPSKGMIRVDIRGPFNFPPNYSQVNSNHPFPATIQYIPNISQLLYSHSNSVNKAIVAVALKCFLHLPGQGNYVRLCQGCFYRCGQAFSCQARPLRCGKGFVFLGKKEKDW